MTEQNLIHAHGDEAIALVLSLLKGKSAAQPLGFQISSTTVRKVLGEHFGRGYGGVWRLAAFVTDALVARGILKPFNKTTKREVFRVDTVTATDSKGSGTPAVFPSHA